MPEEPTFEELLQDELNWRQLLIQESRDSIVILDSDAKVFDANNRFAEMLGYSREEVRELHAWDWDAVFGKEQIQELAKSVDDVGHQFETKHRRKDGSIVDVELSNNGAVYRGQKLILCICRDISDRKRAEAQREELIAKLQESLAEIKTLRGILPVCCFCKKVRDDKGYWEQVDIYITEHSDASVTHGLCPDCLREHYPEIVT
jgi:PAS domain S-box-containing protein